MMRILLLLGLSFIITTVVQAQCEIPGFLREAYDQDVKYLAIKRMMEVNSPDSALVSIPQAWQDTIMEGLAAIYNVEGLPASDSVFNMYCIHDRVGNPVLQSFLIGVEDGTPMEQAWSQGILETGDTIVDNLLSTYDFELVNHTSIYTLFSTPYLINTLALADSLENFVEGVKFAEPNFIIGLAGFIRYTMDSEGIRYYDFYYEWNDCFDGCDNFHAWKFSVDPDCGVTYLGFEEGGFFGVEDLPDPGNCMLTGTEERIDDPSRPLLYPNPANSEIFVVDSFESGDWTIIDLFGRPVLEGDLPVDQINVNTLTPGSYFCIFSNGRGQISKSRIMVMR